MGYTRPTGFSLKPVGPRQRLTVDDTAGGVALTVPSGALTGFGRLETAEIRFTLDSTAPTSTAGQVLKADDTVSFTNRKSLTGFLAIRTTGTNGVFDIEYFGADY